MRYSLLIVDDESLIRKGLAARLAYLNLDFRDIYEASSGKEALELMCGGVQVDIMITDIRMPDMDGLTLIQEAKSIAPDIDFIILSGYAEFEYAEKAISLGVEAYLLKPISKDQLKEVMEKVIGSRRKKEEVEQVLFTHEKLEQERKNVQLEKELLEMLSCYAIQEKNYPMAEETYPKLCMEKYCKYLGIINIAGSEKNNYHLNEMEEMRQIVRRFCETIPAGCDRITLDHPSNRGQIYIIFIHRDRHILRGEIETLFLKLQNLLELKMDVSLSMGISSSTRALSDISAREAKETLQQRLIGGLSNLYFYEDMKQVPTEEIPSSELYMLEHYIERHDLENIQVLVHEIFSEEHISKCSITYVRIIWVRILNMLLHSIEVKTSPKSTEKLLESFGRLEQFENMSQLEAWLMELIGECIDTDKRSDANAKDKVKQAIAYINANYNKEMTITSIAERFGMSSNYFSAVFKREMNQSAVNYITDLRVQKARELLLNTKESVADIAAQVGYEDSQYFFRVFKKTTGVTPLQFRRVTQK